MILPDRRYRRTVMRLLGEILDPTSNCIEIPSADASFTPLLFDLAPSGHHLLLESHDPRIDRLESMIDASQPVRFIRIDADGGGLSALSGLESVLRRDRPFLLIDRRPGTIDTPGTSPGEVYDLLDRCGLKTRTKPQVDESAAKVAPTSEREESIGCDGDTVEQKIETDSDESSCDWGEPNQSRRTMNLGWLGHLFRPRWRVA